MEFVPAFVFARSGAIDGGYMSVGSAARDRMYHVDVAKGACIFLVVLGHSGLFSQMKAANEMLALFRMPLFFFLSGVFVSASKGWKYYVFDKADHLLKPYLSFSVLVLILGFVSGSDWFSAYSLLGVIYATGATIRWIPAWFLPHLYVSTFLVWIFCLCLNRFDVSNRSGLIFAFSVYWVGIFLMRVSPAGWVLYSDMNQNGVLPITLNSLFVSASFMLFGFYSRGKVFDFSLSAKFFLFCAVVFLGVAFFGGVRLDLSNGVVVRPFFSLLCAGLGGYSLFSISVFMSRFLVFRSLFCLLGRASLFVLLFHMPLGRWLEKLMGEGCWVLLVSFFFSLFFPVFIRIFVLNSPVVARFFLPKG